MRKVLALMLLVAILFGAGSLLHQQEAEATTINGYIEPAESGTFYNGDMAKLILNFSTPRVFGHEVLDRDGNFLYDIKATMRLDGSTAVPPKPFGQGIYMPPLAVNKQVTLDLGHPLSVGKWVVNVTVYQLVDSGLEPVTMYPDSWEIDVFQRPQPPELAKSWLQLLWENSATLPATIGGGVIVGIILWRLKQSKAQRSDDWKEKRDELQKITDRIHALPPEYMQNLRYHYCKLKNNGRPVDFSYHPRPALRNQADAIEQTLEGIAITVLDDGVDYSEFKRIHGPFVLRAWVLCEEDIDIKAKTYPATGLKFRQLFQRLAMTMEVPTIQCTDITERMPAVVEAKPTEVKLQDQDSTLWKVNPATGYRTVKCPTCDYQFETSKDAMRPYCLSCQAHFKIPPA